MLSLPANADSPDLGPPPVAHFDAEDPIRFNASQQAKAPIELDKDAENPLALLSANLETRRKRRDSYSASELGRARKESLSYDGEGRATSPVKEDVVAQQHLNPGAKRKLSSREENEVTDGVMAASKDDFKYSRKPGAKVVENATEDNAVSTKQENIVSAKVIDDLGATRGTNHSKPKDSNIAAGSSNRRKALEPSK